MSAVNKDLGNMIQLCMHVHPRRAVQEGSPDEGTDGGVHISLGALTLPIQTHAEVHQMGVHLSNSTALVVLQGCQGREGNCHGCTPW